MSFSKTFKIIIIVQFFILEGIFSQVIPEYGSSRAILYSFGSLPLQVFYVPKESHNNLIDERFHLYQTVVGANPKAQHLFLLNSLFQDDFKNNYSLYFDNKLNHFVTINPHVKILKSRFELSEQAVEWIRDFAPMSVRDHDQQVKFYNTNYRFSNAGSFFANHLGLDIMGETPSKLPGGNIMSDDQGNCYMTDNESDSSITKYCKKIIILPFLDLEGTQHIDLFAKLINSKTVMISNYSSDEVEIIEHPFYLDAICSDEAIALKKMYSCPYTMTADGKPYQVMRDNSQIRSLKFSEIKSFVANQYPGIKIKTHLRSSVNWATHSEVVAKFFRDLGFEVVKLETPKPLLRITIERYKDTRGKILKQEAQIDFVFRSYANSLVTNGAAVVPTYPLTEAKNLDKAALSTYKKYLGDKVYSAPSDYSILGAGAVHCLTHEVPN